jgi:hypothetical protein
MITAGNSAPQTVLSLLNRYSYFTSIETTSQSDALGKYHFMTTKVMFDQLKTFITDLLPQIWAQLDNTFLDELPESVKYPRLTTSNLNNASTTRTAALLQAIAVPNDTTVASRWSKPPNSHTSTATTGHQRTFSDTNFPDLTNTATSKKWKTHTADTSETTATAAQINNASNHSSNASATLAGTTFTREDGQSLFTLLTKSFMNEIKSQHAVVMETNKTLIDWMTKQSERDELIRTKQATQAARERLLRAEQTEHNRQTDQRFFDMIKAFTAQSVNDDRHLYSSNHNRHHPRKHQRSRQRLTPPLANPNAMDTKDNRSSSNDNQARLMETDVTDPNTTNDARQHTETTSAKSESQPKRQSDDSDSVWDTQGQRYHPDETATLRAGQIFPGQIHAIPKLVTNDADTCNLMKKIHASYHTGTRTQTEDTIETDVADNDEQENRRNERAIRTHQQNVNTKVENVEKNTTGTDNTMQT